MSSDCFRRERNIVSTRISTFLFSYLTWRETKLVRIVNHVETLLYAAARKVSGRKTIQSQHCESQFVPGWTDFFLVLFKEIIRDKVFKVANEALNPSLKDVA